MPASHTKSAKTRILLVDDHPFVRQGVAQYINLEPDLTVCAQAGDVTEALQAISTLHPDLAIVDISLPGRDGIELIKDIKALYPACVVLVLSMHDETIYAERVLRAGARGYVRKQDSPQTLVQAIRRVLAGEIVMGPTVVSRFLHHIVGDKSNQWTSPIDLLSDRELEIFRLLGQGQPRKDIANQLHISVKTVESHRTNLRQKLGLNNAAELSRYADQFVRQQKP